MKVKEKTVRGEKCAHRVESNCAREQGQIKVRTDFSFEEKALKTVSRLTRYAVRAFLLIAFFIGSCLLLAASSFTGDGTVITVIFRILDTGICRSWPQRVLRMAPLQEYEKRKIISC